MVMKSVKFEPPKPPPKPSAPPPKAAPVAAKPASASPTSSVRAAFRPDEMSAGRGGALRARAASQLGASSLGTRATSLLSEDADDARVNCLDAANDYLEALPADRRAAAQVIFLDDTRPGAEGVDGHVLVRDGASFVDPLTGNRYPSLHAFDPEHHYVPAGALGGQQVVDVLNTAPNSAERRAVLANVPAGLSRMLVADGWTPPATPANPEGQPFLKVTGRTGLNFRASPSEDGRLLGALVQGTEVQLVEPPAGVAVPEGWAYVEVNGQRGFVWAGPDAVAGSDGKHLGMPYEDDTELGVLRDGSPDSAVEWGRAWDNDEVADAFLDAEGRRMEFGYADQCLRFVMKAYGAAWGENPTRSPHLSNPHVTGERLAEEGASLAGLYPADASSSAQEYALLTDDEGHVLTGTAFGAFTSLKDATLAEGEAPPLVEVRSEAELLALDPRPPDGTIIFFAPTVANGGAGHIALLTWKGDEPYVLSSGSSNSPSVREAPLQEMIDWTGPLIGVANMDSPQVLNPATLPRRDPA